MIILDNDFTAAGVKCYEVAVIAHFIILHFLGAHSGVLLTASSVCSPVNYHAVI